MNTRLKTFLILTAMLLVAFGTSQADNWKTAGKPAYENHSLLIVPALSGDRLSDFNREGFDVVEILEDNRMKVVATARHKEILLTRYGARVEIENIEAYYRDRLGADKTMGGYRTFEEIGIELNALVAVYPDIARLDTIGYSIEGRPIYAFKISDNVGVEEADEPELQFNGLIHAREPLGMAICMETLNHLLAHSAESDIADLINTTQIWFVPCINPDGYVYNEMTNPYGGGMWRKNLRDNGDGSYGIDLNRNWGFMWAAYPNSSDDGFSLIYHGASPFSEPETQVMREFINDHHFVTIVNYHSYGRVHLIPYGVANVLGCPDNNIFDDFVNYQANLVGYNYGPIGGPTGFGGDAACWQYAEQVEKPKNFAYLVETGTEFWPDADEREAELQQHIPANLELIAEVHELFYHPSLYLASNLTHVDSVVTLCTEPFSRTFTFRNVHTDMPISVSMSFADQTPAYNWCTPTTFNGIVNPGDSFTVSFDFVPDGLFPYADGTRAGGQLQLTLISQDTLNTIDLLNYPIMLSYRADYNDGDTLLACADNCPYTANDDQADFDGDGIGDVCDNCWENFNPGQDDDDNDGAGDVCDLCPGYSDYLDSDNDAIPNGCDNCPETANTDQADDDADGNGDLCDICPGHDDNIDGDGDTIPDGCDNCPGFDDLADSDQDAHPDSCDNCPDMANADQVDSDGNGVGDACQVVCGDANGDREANVGDAVYLINYVFKAGPAPDPVCSGDANGDREANVGDAVYLINYVFKNGPAPEPDCCQ